MTFEAIVGASDGMGVAPSMVVSEKGSVPMAAGANTEGAQFKMASARLRETARAYTERQVTQGEGQLLQRMSENLKATLVA
jgi:hypothetical protein